MPDDALRIEIRDILLWAERAESRAGLPELVHRLIRETVRVRLLDLPTGDVVKYPGWDGVVVADRSAFVPEGPSAWEMGVGANPRAKADDDHAKRLANPLGLDPAQTAFVFVTAREWPGKRAWAKARRAEGVWRDVHVLDAGDLHQWLTDAPRASLWFAAEQLGRPAARDAFVEPTRDWRPEALAVDKSPLAWLTWNARLTDLIGRDAETADLLAWARSGGGVSVRLLAGEGGTGKTRLAHEVAQTLAQDPGWAAGLVPADRPLPLDAGRAGCLLLIDYPEERRDALAARLREVAAAAADPDRPVRVLLLSRRGPEEWDAALQDSGAHLRAAPPLILGERMDPAAALAIFRSALARVPRPPGAAAPQEVTEEAFRAWLDRVPINHRPLLIAAAAIQAVADPARAVVDLTAAQVVDALADREARRLRRLAEAHGFARDALCRLAALAAVRGALDGRLLRRLAAPDLDLGLGPATGLIDRLEPTGLLAAGRFPAPRPDIAAAALTLRTLAARPDDAPEWLWAVVEDAPTETLARLERLSYDIDVVLGHHARGFSRWLTAMVDGRVDRATVVDAHLPPVDLSPTVSPLAAAALRVRIDAGIADRAELAGALNNLSVRLSSAGDGAGALAAVREAAGLYRDLATANPPRFVPDLAGALNNLSNALSSAGDGAGALAAVREAAGLYRDLATANPARFVPDLAGALNTLSNALSAAGDGAGALAAVREAAGLYRDLATANPARFAPELATALNTLSNALSAAGDGSGALAAVREAAGLYRDLATANPARFAPELATALNNLSVRLSDAGDGSGALAAVREAVGLYRDLATANPARFAPDLAMALNNLSVYLSAAGDGSGALAAVREAAGLYRDLATANPARFAPDLATALNNLSVRLSDAGDGSGALAAVREAAGLYRDLATANPARFAPDLAGALNNLSNALSAAGDGSGALAAVREAAGLYRDLATANPARFAPELAMALGNRSWRLLAQGEVESALVDIEDAVRLIEPAAQAYPDSLYGRWHRMMLKQRRVVREAAGWSEAPPDGTASG